MSSFVHLYNFFKEFLSHFSNVNILLTNQKSMTLKFVHNFDYLLSPNCLQLNSNSM